MKVAICSDLHLSEYSSIIRGQGKKYTKRLENCIDSLRWVIELARVNNCSFIFQLGDMFDKPTLTAEEISALKEIDWNANTWISIAGNHEMQSVDHSFTSADIFSLLDTGELIRKPYLMTLGGIEFFALPYILESERKPLTDYLPPRTDKKRVILSHNDIKGIQMGPVISKTGFTIEEIEENCDLFINGHLHNGTQISEKIYNIGNLTGQNFSEDAYRYNHCAFVLDTETLRIKEFINPVAFNFYKLDLTKDLNYEKLKQNAIITVKCIEKDYEKVKSIIQNDGNVIESRILVDIEHVEGAHLNKEDLQVDHLKVFKEYILNTLGKSDIIEEELAEVLK